MWNKKINEKIDKLNEVLEKANIRYLSYILGSRKEIFKRNFLAGVARGLGMTIGVAMITVLFIYGLQKVVKMNIPVIGDFVVDIIHIVEKKK